MAMMNAQQYRDSLAKRKPLKVYLDGKLLADPLAHPYIRTSMNTVALTYELAQDPEHKNLMTAKSALTGATINRFCHLHQSTEDLIDKVRMQRLLGQRCGTCFQRCVGLDALNAVFAATFDMDRKLGTCYHARFRKFAIAMEQNDWIVDGAMTDVKGDRAKRPAEHHNGPLFASAWCGVWHTAQTVFGSAGLLLNWYCEKSCLEPTMPAWAVKVSREPAATVRARRLMVFIIYIQVSYARLFIFSVVVCSVWSARGWISAPRFV